MSVYKEVDNIFSETDKYTVSSKCMINSPYQKDGVLTEAQILRTLDDGVEIELCLWTDFELGISCWDVSITKEQFERTGEPDFLSYLKKNGFYLDNLKDKYSKWRYCGLQKNEDIYRIQYCEVD